VYFKPVGLTNQLLLHPAFISSGPDDVVELILHMMKKEKKRLIKKIEIRQHKKFLW